MTRLGGFLSKQGRFLLENDKQALVYIAVLALIPLTGWLAAAIIALITLRKGFREGLKGFLVAFMALLTLSLMTQSLYAAFINAALVFIPCYLTAAVLHSTRSWKLAGGVIVLQALLVIVLIHWLTPEFITNQIQYIQAIFHGHEKESFDSTALELLNNQSKFRQKIVAHYLLGVQSIVMAMSALASLTLARSIQSRLFNPGGFRQEMLEFRASAPGVCVLGIAAIGAYQHNLLAISCLPILATYYVFAGLSLTFRIIAKDKDKDKVKGIGNMVLLVVPLFILPFVMLPAYTILGALDSLFNFRTYLPFKTDKKEKKG
ncbi:MAG: DUF2232 domain-containing protein [Tatlockia sp.]|nr:DUF2232 domain-containing protein [Tatlockia sp.]